MKDEIIEHEMAALIADSYANDAIDAAKLGCGQIAQIINTIACVGDIELPNGAEFGWPELFASCKESGTTPYASVYMVFATDAGDVIASTSSQTVTGCGGYEDLSTWACDELEQAYCDCLEDEDEDED